jgi:hypothetical protein
MSERIPTFAEFWPYYLSEHGDTTNRRLHYVGSTLALMNAAAAIVLLNPFFLLSAAISGYFFAWIGHFIIEKNRPATFKYPFWSLFADFRMYFLALTGRLRPHLDRAGVAA